MDKQDPIELICAVQSFSNIHAPEETQQNQPDMSQVPPYLWDTFNNEK